MFAARKMIFVKDEDGFYTADPKKDADAKHISRISSDERIAPDLGDLIAERTVLGLTKNAKHGRAFGNRKCGPCL